MHVRYLKLWESRSEAAENSSSVQHCVILAVLQPQMLTHAHTHLLGSNLIVWSEGMGLYYRTCFFAVSCPCLLGWVWTLGLSCRNRQEGSVVQITCIHNEHVGCPDFFVCRWCVCSRCADWSRLGLLGRREMDKKREASALCGAVDF